MDHTCRTHSSPDPAFGRRWHVTCAKCGRLTRGGLSRAAADDMAEHHLAEHSLKQVAQ